MSDRHTYDNNWSSSMSEGDGSDVMLPTGGGGSSRPAEFPDRRKEAAKLALKSPRILPPPDPIPQPQPAPVQQDEASGQVKKPPTEENVKQAMSAQQGTPVNELPAHLQMPEPPFSQDWLKANWDRMSFGDRVAATASWKRYRKDVHDTFLRRDRVMSQNIQTLRGAGGKYGGRWVVTGKGKHRRPSLIYSGETRMRPARSQQEREQMLVNPAAFLEKDDYGEGPFGAGSRTRSSSRRSRTRGGDDSRMSRHAKRLLSGYAATTRQSPGGLKNMIPQANLWANATPKEKGLLNMSPEQYSKWYQGEYGGDLMTRNEAWKNQKSLAGRVHSRYGSRRSQKYRTPGADPRYDEHVEDTKIQVDDAKSSLNEVKKDGNAKINAARKRKAALEKEIAAAQKNVFTVDVVDKADAKAIVDDLKKELSNATTAVSTAQENLKTALEDAKSKVEEAKSRHGSARSSRRKSVLRRKVLDGFDASERDGAEDLFNRMWNAHEEVDILRWKNRRSGKITDIPSVGTMKKQIKDKLQRGEGS